MVDTMERAPMTAAQALVAFAKADEAWTKDLQRVFGKRAGDVRYTHEGATHPECVQTYWAFKEAGEVYRIAMESIRRSSR